MNVVVTGSERSWRGEAVRAAHVVRAGGQQHGGAALGHGARRRPRARAHEPQPTVAGVQRAQQRRANLRDIRNVLHLYEARGSVRLNYKKPLGLLRAKVMISHCRSLLLQSHLL